MAMTPGLDLQRVTAWLAEAVPGLDVLDASAEVIPGGKSNLTYAIVFGGRTYVLRRPPLGHVLATAHDMAREYRVMSALAGTGVPVPRMVALCEETDVTGATFYLMEYVAGTAYRSAADLRSLGSERTRNIALGLVDTLIALHGVNPAGVGMADFGRPTGFLERQTRRWREQMDGSLHRPMPGADALHALLLERLPVDRGISRIVHGDYRLDNVLVDDADQPASVIDWEMATLGDPLTDLALLMIYGRLAVISGGAGIADATTAPGYPAEDEILARYAEGTGADLSRFGFYLGLAAYKLAAILEGIHYRHQQGQTVGAGFDGIGAATAPLLDLGIAAMKEYD
jgi:aminoglycoside phosphotransferase (APT) family kinase protein